jgi:hypothetical protein
MVRMQYQGADDTEEDEGGPTPIVMPKGYDPDWTISGDKNAQNFIVELAGEDGKGLGLFLSKSIDFHFTPDQAMEIYYRDRRMERALVNGFLGTGNSQEMFALLGSPKGLKWLRTGNNLELFFFAMRMGFGRRL